jgi:hypothetical protein
MSEVILAMSACRTSITELYQTGGTPPGANNWGCEGVQSKYVAGLSYAIAPSARIGNRISDLRVRATRMEASKRYKVAGWAPVAEGVGGEPVWDVAVRHLRALRTVPALKAGAPRVTG